MQPPGPSPGCCFHCVLAQLCSGVQAGCQDPPGASTQRLWEPRKEIRKGAKPGKWRSWFSPQPAFLGYTSSWPRREAAAAPRIWAHQGDGLSRLPVLGQTGLMAVPEEQAQRKRSFGEGDSSLLTLQLLCCSQTPDSREVAPYPWGSPPSPRCPEGTRQVVLLGDGCGVGQGVFPQPNEGLGGEQGVSHMTSYGIFFLPLPLPRNADEH